MKISGAQLARPPETTTKPLDLIDKTTTLDWTGIGLLEPSHIPILALKFHQRIPRKSEIVLKIE
jgi:hypothetical protein